MTDVKPHHIHSGGITTSPTLAEIAPALTKAQAEMGHAAKDSRNPHFKSSYASLPACIDGVRAILAASGLCVIQAPRSMLYGDGMVTVDTRVLHSSGEWVQCAASCQPKDVGPQSVGGAITYLRRYGLQAILCQGSEDDDGETAEGRPSGFQAVDDLPPAVTISEPQQKRLYAISKNGRGVDAVKAHIHEQYGFATSKEIPRGKVYDDICAWAGAK